MEEKIMSRSTITIQITITDHAFDRAKERLGFDHHATKRIAMKAYIAGKKHAQCKGQLKKFIDALYLQYEKANNIRIYGEAIYLFRFDTLITIYNLPNEFKTLAKK